MFAASSFRVMVPNLRVFVLRDCFKFFTVCTQFWIQSGCSFRSSRYNMYFNVLLIYLLTYRLAIAISVNTTGTLFRVSRQSEREKIQKKRMITFLRYMLISYKLNDDLWHGLTTSRSCHQIVGLSVEFVLGYSAQTFWQLCTLNIFCALVE